LERGHLGRSAVEVGGACQGFLQPRGSRAVAALVRARSAGFKPRSRVSTTHTGAQWTGRHTHGLHNSVSAVKDLLGLDISQACNASATKTIAAHPASAAQTFCVADFTVGMMSAEDSAR